MTPTPILGVILAGGLARRMGGGDKGLAPFGDGTILDRVVAALRPQVETLVINANGDSARFVGFRLPVLPDDLPGFPGPLAGILAGLDHAASLGFDHILSVPCDAPFLPNDLVARLEQARREAQAEGALATSGGRRHPVVALWPVARRGELRCLVLEGLARVDAAAVRFDLAPADWPAFPVDPFLNVNDEAGLSAALAIARGRW